MSFCSHEDCWQLEPCALHESVPPPPAPPSAPSAFFANLKQVLRLGTARTRTSAAMEELKGRHAANIFAREEKSKSFAHAGPVQWSESEFRARLLQQKNKLKDVATEVKHAPLEVQLQGYGPNWTRFLLDENRHLNTASAAESSSASPESDPLHGLRNPNHEGIQVCLIPIPGEVWLLIFRFLPPGEHLTLESTCKDLLTLGYLWDSWPLSISVSKYEKSVTNHVVASRFACLADARGENKEGSSIRYSLNFSDTAIGEQGIKALINVPVETLELNRCHSLPDTCFSTRPSSVWPRTLHTLGVENCLGLTDGVLGDVGQMHALTSVNLCYVKRVTDEGIRKLATLTNLRRLDLTHSRIGDIGLHNMIRGATNIEELVLSECHRILHLRSVSTLPRLRRLEIADMAHLTDEVLREGLSTMGTLTSLNLSSCKLSDETLATLTNCPGLTALNVSSCSKISQRGFANLQLPLLFLDLSMLTFQALPPLPLLPALLPPLPLPVEEAGEGGPPDAPPLSLPSHSLSSLPAPVSRLSFLTNFLTLTNLNLAHCEGISDIDLRPLALLSQLTHLSLRHHSKLTDQGILVLRGLPLLELDLTYCSRITDEGLIQALSESPSLRSLNISHCKLLNDAGVTQLLTLLPNLQDMDVSNCVRIHYAFKFWPPKLRVAYKELSGKS